MRILAILSASQPVCHSRTVCISIAGQVIGPVCGHRNIKRMQIKVHTEFSYILLLVVTRFDFSGILIVGTCVFNRETDFAVFEFVHINLWFWKKKYDTHFWLTICWRWLFKYEFCNDKVKKNEDEILVEYIANPTL